MVLGFKSVFDFSQMRRKKMMGSSQVAPNVITIFIVNKMPQFKMNDGNIQSDYPNLGLGLIKMDYFKVG